MDNARKALKMKKIIGGSVVLTIFAVMAASRTSGPRLRNY
jgi:hypothetical protein